MLKFEKFFFDVSTPLLQKVNITPSSPNGQIMTNAVTRDFLFGYENLILGRRPIEGLDVKVSGESTMGFSQYLFKIPPKALDGSNTTAKGTPSNVADHLKNKFLERLWRFSKIRRILFKEEKVESKVQVVNNPPSDQDTLENALKWAKESGFITNKTAFILTTGNIAPVNTAQSDDYEPPYIIEKSLKLDQTTEAPPTCYGSLHFYSRTYLRGPKFILNESVNNTLFDYDTATSLLVSGTHFGCPVAGACLGKCEVSLVCE